MKQYHLNKTVFETGVTQYFKSILLKENKVRETKFIIVLRAFKIGTLKLIYFSQCNIVSM